MVERERVEDGGESEFERGVELVEVEELDDVSLLK